MSLPGLDCKNCQISAGTHLCWRHSKHTAECRMVSHKWAPSKCRDCIRALEKMCCGSAAERKQALDSYTGFLNGARQFVERVSASEILYGFSLC